MKKLICLLTVILLSISLSGCGMVYIDDSKEQKAYSNTVDSLFNALDNKNGDAVYQLFSPFVRENDKDLKNQIENLLSVYSGPTDEIGWDGLLSGGGTVGEGNREKNAETIFPVRSGDTYFWCYLNIIYVNTFDESQIGIAQLKFYTDDEYCILRYDENAIVQDSYGLEVYTEKTIEEEIRCIDGWPHKYNSSTKELDIDAVKSFFKTSNSFSKFEATFGKANAENIFTYYTLPQVNGKFRYLELGTTNDEIYCARIVDDFSYIETVFDEE